MPQLRVPSATYRLQFNRSLTFQQAAELVDYLHDLGVSDCYAAPVLRAVPGSRHGYDVIDPSSLNPEIGSEEDFFRFARQLRERQMGLLMDVVPNHMCISGGRNRYWNDVLENGPSSSFARFFDIDWRPPKAELRDKVLFPVLGDSFGKVLEAQRLRLCYEEGAFIISYGDLRLPVAPRSGRMLLQKALSVMMADLGDGHPHRMELESILTALSHLPPPTETDAGRVRERYREKEVIRRRLSALYEVCPELRRGLSASLEALNGRPGDPRSFDELEELLSQQVYRLSFWRVAAEEINYRRFFDVNELAAIRVEEPEVFQVVHGLVLRFIREGLCTGLRIDHVDGLFDPEKYLADLQAACGGGLYVVVEKILGRGEQLRDNWPVHGTTGYEFATQVGGLFVDAVGAQALQQLYARLAGTSLKFSDVVYESKKLILQVSMSSELHVLAHKLDRISEQHRMSRDFTFNSLRNALAEVIACFPVYRSYVRVGTGEVSDEDRRQIVTAIHKARWRSAAVSGSIFDFIGQVLLLQDPEDLNEHARAERREFVMRFQQLTGPVMAKGLEDTAFYRYAPLASLNEVGGDAGATGVSAEAFHAANQERLRRFPGSLLCTSTHDTKRSEDVRARISVLSEVPQLWADALARWQRMNGTRKIWLDDGEVPDPRDEYLLYQTLLGVWPLGPSSDGEREELVGRVEAYMLKALKEAKLYTSWINPNEPYENGVRDFVRGILSPGPDNEFLHDFARLHGLVASAGMLNSMSQVLLKMASPGVPDLYQGCEIWDFSLVDPDNRRPVDFRLHQDLLRSLREAPSGRFVDRLLRRPEDGRIKLYVTRLALRFRRDHQELFLKGEYLPLQADGDLRDHVVAFARGRSAIAVAGRFFARLGLPERLPVGERTWAGTGLVLPPELAARRYREVFSGRELTVEQQQGRAMLPLAAVFAHLTVALLEGIP